MTKGEINGYIQDFIFEFLCETEQEYDINISALSEYIVEKLDEIGEIK